MSDYCVKKEKTNNDHRDPLCPSGGGRNWVL